MTLARTLDRRIRAVIFDLDRTLIDGRRAWCYSIEEAILATRGERIDAAPLAGEYQYRPWRDAISILEPERTRQDRCVTLCEAMYTRSAMKRLLVFDGIGMMLDELRGARVEVGAISRLPHNIARKQIESTGLERFIAVLESLEEGAAWQPEALVQRCAAFLETEALGYVGIEDDRIAVEDLGLRCYTAIWPGEEPGHIDGGLESPRALLAALGG